MHNLKIGFIGGGNMATALIGGLLAQGYSADSLAVSDPQATLLAQHAANGVQTFTDNQALMAFADIILLAVKPQVMQTVLSPLHASVQNKKPLIISIAAGIPIQALDTWLGGNVAIVRAMPNTPALVLKGAAGLYANVHVGPTQKQQAEKILGAVGVCVWLQEESLIDAVTAVSGSGPAYFFYVMEAMIKAGVALGLDEETARILTLQTALGAADMAIHSDVDPAELRRRVTSPGGTTEQAILQFQAAQLPDIFHKAMQACANRGQTLAEELGKTH